VPYIESAAAFDKVNGNLNIFIINRNWKEDIQIVFDVRNFDGYEFTEQLQLYIDDLDAANSYEDPNVIVPSICSIAKFRDNKVVTTVKKLSWNVFCFSKV
jgi:alpha-N-arabinofuranosidase